MKRNFFLLLLIIILSLLFISSVNSKDLIATLANLPGLAETPDKGAYVDLLKAIDEVYTDGKIIIGVYPFNRSLNNLWTGNADLHLPCIRNPFMDRNKDQPDLFSTITIGKASFVIYSSINNKITKKMIDDIIGKKEISYKIEVPGGLETNFPFPVTSTNYIDRSLKKLEANRIDAIIWAQDEADFIIKSLKIKTIYRENWLYFDDVFLLQNNKWGKELDLILADCIKKLKKSGKLQKLYSKIHIPYDDWQPSEMDW